MEMVSVDEVGRPMVYVTTTARMDFNNVQVVMGKAFASLGQFLGRTGTTPVGPPLAIYHDWDDKQTQIDVGFPISPKDAAKAGGEIKVGKTPEGPAIKAVHRGSYDGFAQTYAAIDAEMKAHNVPPVKRMWEVYLGDPQTTPPDQLVTEIYYDVPPAEAAKFPHA